MLQVGGTPARLSNTNRLAVGPSHCTIMDSRCQKARRSCRFTPDVSRTQPALCQGRTHPWAVVGPKLKPRLLPSRTLPMLAGLGLLRSNRLGSRTPSRLAPIGANSAQTGPATRGVSLHLHHRPLHSTVSPPRPSDRLTNADSTQSCSEQPARMKSALCLGCQAGMPDSSALSSMGIVMRLRLRPVYSPLLASRIGSD